MSKVLDEVHLTNDGGVIKRLLAKGEGEQLPEKGQEVLVNYEGRLEDGTVFDTSYDKGEPLNIFIGTGQVIKGWDIGIMAMRLGEKADLVIKPEYGYGAVGAPPKIPGNATLIFTVELIQIGDRIPTRWMMSNQELIAVALRYKDDGNLRFKAGKLKEAEGFYWNALTHLDTVKNDNKELKDLKKTILVNLALVCNKGGNYKQALVNCSKALDIDAQNVKAHFFRAQAYAKLFDFDEALEDMKAAIKLNPGDKGLRDEFEKLKSERSKHTQSQQRGFQKFFQEGIYNEKEASITKKEYKLPEFDQENPQVFMDVEVGREGEEGHRKGRVVFELFRNKTPTTAENFRCLCTGEKGEELSYKGNIFHRIIPNFMMQGGDISNQNGTGGMSIYGAKFEDEKVWLPHTHQGILSMANSGPNTNGSQFFICFAATPHLNEKHTVFGRAISGFDICRFVEKVKTGAQDKPLTPVTIVDCGELQEKLTRDSCDFLKVYEGQEEEPVPEEKRVEL